MSEEQSGKLFQNEILFCLWEKLTQQNSYDQSEKSQENT